MADNWAWVYVANLRGPQGPAGPSGSPGGIEEWKANTAYAAGKYVIAPNGDPVKAKATFTSGATYDATKWTESALFKTRAVLPDGTNIDNLTTPGVYTIATTTSAGTMVNLPFGYAGTVWVYKTDDSAVTVQKALGSIGTGNVPEGFTRIRRTSASAWPVWTPDGPVKSVLADATNIDTVRLSGSHIVKSFNSAETMINLPVPFPGVLDVVTSTQATVGRQTYVARVAEGQVQVFHRVTTSATTWPAWDEIGAEAPVVPVTAGNLGLDQEAMRDDFLRARGGSIGTGGKAAVSFRFDHGLANFKNVILPLLLERDLPCGLAINTDPVKWTYEENAGTSWTDVQDWSNNHGVEIIGHSHTHADSTTEADILANLVTDPMAAFNTNIPNFQVEGFAIPGGSADYLGWTATNLPEHFTSKYAAARAVLANYAFCTGHLGGAIRPLMGEINNGQRHQGMDSVTDANVIIDVIKRAQALTMGVNIMMHPSLLNTTGYYSTAVLTAVLDYVVAERDAGRLEVVTMSGLFVADSRHSFRQNIMQPFGSTAWTNTTGYTVAGDVATSDGTAGLMLQNVNMSDLNAVKGRIRELIVEARSATGSTLQISASSSVGAGSGTMNKSKTWTIPGDNVWRKYRIFVVVPKTGFSTNCSMGRASGGALELRSPRFQAS